MASAQLHHDQRLVAADFVTRQAADERMALQNRIPDGRKIDARGMGVRALAQKQSSSRGVFHVRDIPGGVWRPAASCTLSQINKAERTPSRSRQRLRQSTALRVDVHQTRRASPVVAFPPAHPSASKGQLPAPWRRGTLGRARRSASHRSGGFVFGPTGYSE